MMSDSPATSDHRTRASGEQWSRAAQHAAKSGTEVDQQCEHLLDEELDDTFPASDPPSWTMGGSVVSMLRH